MLVSFGIARMCPITAHGVLLHLDTFVCPTEIAAFNSKLKEFEALNAQVLTISTDSHFVLHAWNKAPRDQGGLGIVDLPLVSDLGGRISHNYGVLIEDTDDELFGAALRALFIIDAKGVVRSVQVNDDSVGRSVDETIRLIQGFQVRNMQFAMLTCDVVIAGRAVC